MTERKDRLFRDSVVEEALKVGGPQTRGELIKRTGFSGQSVSRALAVLLDEDRAYQDMWVGGTYERERWRPRYAYGPQPEWFILPPKPDRKTLRTIKHRDYNRRRWADPAYREREAKRLRDARANAPPETPEQAEERRRKDRAYRKRLRERRRRERDRAANESLFEPKTQWAGGVNPFTGLKKI